MPSPGPSRVWVQRPLVLSHMHTLPGIIAACQVPVQRTALTVLIQYSA